MENTKHVPDDQHERLNSSLDDSSTENNLEARSQEDKTDAWKELNDDLGVDDGTPGSEDLNVGHVYSGDDDGIPEGSEFENASSPNLPYESEQFQQGLTDEDETEPQTEPAEEDSEYAGYQNIQAIDEQTAQILNASTTSNASTPVEPKAHIVAPEVARKRKQLLVLPVFFFVCATFLFWKVLGGAKNVKTPEELAATRAQGLNMSIPEPAGGDVPDSKIDHHYKDKVVDNGNLTFKLFGTEDTTTSDHIEKDLQHLGNQPATAEQQRKNVGVNTQTMASDPQPETPQMRALRMARREPIMRTNRALLEQEQGPPADGSPRYRYKPSPAASTQNRRSAAGYRDPYAATEISDAQYHRDQQEIGSVMATEAKYEARLEIMQRQMKRQQQLLDSMRQAGDEGRVKAYRGNVVSSIGNRKLGMRNNFHGTGSDGVGRGNEVAAVVHDETTIETGNTVKLRLTEDAVVEDTRIPANTFVYATATMSNERLELAVTSLQYKGRIYTCNLVAYDIDGLQGIHVPGARTSQGIRQASGQVISQSARSSGRRGIIGTVTRAASSIVGQGARAEKVTVTSGYRIILKLGGNASF